MLGVFRDDKCTYLVMEYLSKGSLRDFLKQHNTKTLQLFNMLKMALDVCSGMAYLGEHNIIHRDLGSRNLLVATTDEGYIVKIADLGLSREVNENIYVSTDTLFPVKWSPPEVIQHREFTVKSDVWSFGVVLWEIFEFGKVPYGDMSNSETIKNLLAGYRLPIPENCPTPVPEIMMKCWNSEPTKRPSFKEIQNDLVKSLPSYRNDQSNTGSKIETEIIYNVDTEHKAVSTDYNYNSHN